MIWRERTDRAKENENLRIVKIWRLAKEDEYMGI